MDINLILLAPNSMIIGWQYYQPEQKFDFKEIKSVKKTQNNIS